MVAELCSLSRATENSLCQILASRHMRRKQLQPLAGSRFLYLALHDRTELHLGWSCHVLLFWSPSFPCIVEEGSLQKLQSLSPVASPLNPKP